MFQVRVEGLWYGLKLLRLTAVMLIRELGLGSYKT